MNKILENLLVAVFMLLQTSSVGAFEVDTHRALSARAVDASNLDDFLKNALGLPGGIDTNLSNAGVTQTVTEWIEEGSDREDDGFRYFNHFHNPLENWNQAGLRVFSGQLGSSSILWGQRPGQGAAWQDARNIYFEALTATTQQDRDAELAATFQAIGNLIHLPQDAAVPAHTRNDQHLFFEGFERFAFSITGTARFEELTLNPTGFSSSVLTLSQNPLAPIPVARITDATDPQQSEAVPSAGTNQGMAEYSNANFLSGDTIFKNFTFPRIQSIDLNNPVLISNRRYFQKVSDGDTGYLLAAEGSFTERLLALAAEDKGFVLDRLVYDSYASKLLPRAVGYSAGLIDYFFRGRMEAENLSGSFAPSCPSCPRTQLTVAGILRNLLAPGEGLQQVQGQQQLVAVFLTQENNQTVYHVSSPSTVNLADEFLGEVTFDFSSSPISVHPDVFYQNWPCTVVGGSVPCEVQFIYRGPLGKEVDSVIVLNAIMDID